MTSNSTLSMNIENENQPQRRSLQEFGYDKMTLLPVRCFTCSRIIGNKQETYESYLSQGYSIGATLNKMGIMSTCCRDKFMNPPKLPAGLVLNSSDANIAELYNSFQLKPPQNFENTTGNPYYNPQPLDPNKPRPSRTYYLTKPKNKFNDIQRQRVVQIENLANAGPNFIQRPVIPNIPISSFNTDIETVFDELNLETIPEFKQDAKLQPSDLYYIRQQINAINLGVNHGLRDDYVKREFNNIIDRLLINLINFNTGYQKAIEEMTKKRLNPAIIDTVKDIIINYRRNRNKTPTSDPEFQKIYQQLNIKYPKVSEDAKINATLRYLGLSIGGQQFALDPAIISRIATAGINTEAFASPLNHTFQRYYSIFTEDSEFGSIGSFFGVSHPADELLYANPPFVPKVLEDIVPIMSKIHKAVIITPTWRDAPWYAGLKNAGYTPYVYKGIVYLNNDKEIIPNFETTIWTKNINIVHIMNGMKGIRLS
jgi:DNA-directed RNA polymerase subunit N (RpoN/RPB10)